MFVIKSREGVSFIEFTFIFQVNGTIHPVSLVRSLWFCNFVVIADKLMTVFFGVGSNSDVFVCQNGRFNNTHINFDRHNGRTETPDDEEGQRCI